MSCVFMDMHATPLSELLDKYLTESLAPEEREELMKRLDDPAELAELEKLLENSFLDDRFEAADNPVLQAHIHEFLQQQIDAEQTPVIPMRKNRILRFVAAAAVVILIGGIWWMNADKQVPTEQVAGNDPHYKNDVQPVSQGVILTLGDGRAINLEASPDGALVTEGGTSLSKQDSSIRYSNVHQQTQNPVYNTIATSFGSTYQLELSDGTRVWLNATSSLRFPVSFSGANRVVELSGEGYFEVAKNSKQPFLVRSGNATVQVLGTRFNMNAYDDGIRTTLLDGSVKVNEQLLKPGQQGILKKNMVVVEKAAIDEVMAWKNNMFNFNYRGITEIMKEVERWYGVKVVYGAPVNGKFSTTLQRNMPVSKLLRNLELTGELKFSIEGKTITVIPVTP
jgi:transmembrane sensor